MTRAITLFEGVSVGAVGRCPALPVDVVTVCAVAEKGGFGVSGVVSLKRSSGEIPTLVTITLDQMDATCIVKGKALYSDGRPCPKVSLRLAPFLPIAGVEPWVRDWLAGAYQLTHADEDGRFSFPAVQTSQQGTLSAWIDGRKVAEIDSAPAELLNNLRIVIPEIIETRFLVLLDEQPIAQARILGSYQTNEGLFGRDNFKATTDSSGRFSLQTHIDRNNIEASIVSVGEALSANRVRSRGDWKDTRPVISMRDELTTFLFYSLAYAKSQVFTSNSEADADLAINFKGGVDAMPTLARNNMISRIRSGLLKSELDIPAAASEELRESVSTNNWDQVNALTARILTEQGDTQK